MKGAKIGENCQLGQNVFVDSMAEIGKGWMCECGVKLQIKNKIAICNACKKKYFKDKSGLKNNN